jgi:ABC-type uncharacterized transport system ATPase subunit
VLRVELRDVRKRFGSVLALDGAGLALAPGEVHALLGENGAGKTTLVRILYGVVRPDSGEIRIDAVPTAVRGPRHALELGVGLVHQHFMLVPELTVAENLALGESGAAVLGARTLRAQFLGARALRAHAEPILDRYGLDFPPDLPVAELSVAQKQRLEIARALSRGVEVLILDEPTAVLAPSETDAILELLGRLRDEGRSIVFISHKLEEITAVCDRVTVLRDGKTVATREVSGLDPRELGALMVGEELPPPGRPPQTRPGEVALCLAGVVAGALRGIDLELRAGEVLAVAGIDGNGQTPLEELLAGVREAESGRVEVRTPPLALLSGDRQRTGLVLPLPVEENLVLADAARGGVEPEYRWGLARRGAIRESARAAIEHMGIRAEPRDPARTLSGGNQQKLCVARALRGDPRVVVAVNPTRGLDVAATAQVRDELREQARRGTAVLLISTDLDEVLELGTRVSVLFRGELLPVEPERRTRERIGELMLGRAAA